MTQAELDKKLGAALKREATARGWATKSGRAFKVEGEMFFSVVFLASRKERECYWSLKCKPLAFDDLLWRILGMPANLKEPTSLRATGAFTLNGIELHSHRVQGIELDDASLDNLCRAMMEEVVAHATDASVHTVDEYLQLAEGAYLRILEKSPKAAWNIWKERLLRHVLREEFDDALRIAEHRDAAGDTGGLINNGQSFYKHAKKFIVDLPSQRVRSGR